VDAVSILVAHLSWRNVDMDLSQILPFKVLHISQNAGCTMAHLKAKKSELKLSGRIRNEHPVA
jgi:hypothetical protein